MTHNLFESYFTYVKDTEPPKVFHRWSIITCVGALLGRQYHLPFGDFNIFPNMYVMLIGDPGTRKSTAIKLAKKVTAAAGYDKFSAEKTSKEKFLLDLEGIEDDTGKVLDTSAAMRNLFGDDFVAGDPREVFICADEFNEFVGSGNLEFLSLLGSLWDWDDPNVPFKQRLKTSRSVSIYQPTISILSGNTHAGFNEAFPPAAIGQGFMSRLLLVYGESSGIKIAFPQRPPEALKQELVDTLQAIRSEVCGEAKITAKARNMLEVIYRTFPGLEDVRFKHYSTRRFTHLLKLCLISSAANLRTEITAEDVMFANTLLSFTEHRMPQAMGEFGKAKNADVAAKIIGILAEAKLPIDQNALWKQVAQDLDRPDDLSKLLAGLTQAGKIQFVAAKNGGQSGYLIVRKMLSNKQVYVDYSLLKEAEHHVAFIHQVA